MGWDVQGEQRLRPSHPAIVQCAVRNDHSCFAVEPGAGAGHPVPSAASPAAGPGTGLARLRRALELCHGPATRLELASAPGGGACVRLSMPAELAA